MGNGYAGQGCGCTLGSVGSLTLPPSSGLAPGRLLALSEPCSPFSRLSPLRAQEIASLPSCCKCKSIIKSNITSFPPLSDMISFTI